MVINVRRRQINEAAFASFPPILDLSGANFWGNYVLVDTNHALTLDWFRSPRGP